MFGTIAGSMTLRSLSRYSISSPTATFSFTHVSSRQNGDAPDGDWDSLPLLERHSAERDLLASWAAHIIEHHVASHPAPDQAQPRVLSIAEHYGGVPHPLLGSQRPCGSMGGECTTRF